MIGYFVFFGFILNALCNSDSWIYVDVNKGAPAPSVPFPNAQFKIKFSSEQTCDIFTAVEIEVLHGEPGNHVHTFEDEFFNIIEGEVQFIVNGTQFCARQGDYVYVPKNVSQTFRVHNPNFTKKRAKIQIVMFKAGGEGFFREMATFYLQGSNNDTIVDEIAKKYGFAFLEPVVWDDLGCFSDDRRS